MLHSDAHLPLTSDPLRQHGPDVEQRKVVVIAADPLETLARRRGTRLLPAALGDVLLASPVLGSDVLELGRGEPAVGGGLGERRGRRGGGPHEQRDEDPPEGPEQEPERERLPSPRAARLLALAARRSRSRNGSPGMRGRGVDFASRVNQKTHVAELSSASVIRLQTVVAAE